MHGGNQIKQALGVGRRSPLEILGGKGKGMAELEGE